MSGVGGVPDEMLGQVLHAFVVIDEKKGLTPTIDELAEFAGARLSAFKVPDRWTFVKALPLNSIGKIDRKRLLEFREHQE